MKARSLTRFARPAATVATAKRPAAAVSAQPTGAADDKTVDSYIASLDDWRGQVIARLRHIIREAAPRAEEAIKWAQPVYSQDGPFCYMKAFRNHVNFGFWRGMEIDDPGNLLVGKGGKMAHIKIASLSDVRAKAFRALVEHAVALNRTHGDPTKRTA